MSAVSMKSCLVKVTSGIEGLIIAPREGYSYQGNAVDGYRAYGSFNFQITAENEELLDEVTVSSDKGSLYGTGSSADGLTRYYQLWDVTEDAQITIGYQSSLKLVNDKERVTLKADLFKGNVAMGLTSGQKVRLAVSVKEGYDADTVKVTQVINNNDEEEVKEISLKASADSLYRECEITLAAGDNVIKVTEPEKSVYRITLPTDTAYTVVPQGGSREEAEFGDSYQFKITVSEGYDAAKMAVMANGSKLTPDSDGIYTILNINKDCIITVEGIEKTKSPDNPDVSGTETKISDDTTITILVNKITITGISKKIAAGKSVILTAQVAPVNALEQSVEWSSSNTKYATVSANGKVTAKKAGAGKKVTITATAKDGSGVTAAYQIAIQKKAVTKIKLSAKSKSVKTGKKLKITAKVTPSKDVNKTLLWSCSNEKYATVNSKGVVTTKKAGKGKTVTITAKAADGSGKKAAIKIKITK